MLIESIRNILKEDTMHRNAARHTINDREVWDNGGYDASAHHHAMKSFLGSDYNFHKAHAAINTTEMELEKKRIHSKMYGR